MELLNYEVKRLQFSAYTCPVLFLYKIKNGTFFRRAYLVLSSNVSS
jgi:hypothetical protein